MSHKNRLLVFTILLTILGLVFNLGNVMVSASASNLSTPNPLTTETPEKSPTSTLTPGLQMNAKPESWLDGAINPEEFGPMDALIVHFNTPMSPESSPHPVLSWPNVEGVSTWNNIRTVLMFKPTSALDSKKTYTFFLDPSLRSADGKAMKIAPEWIVHVQSGPKILHVSPEPGSLAQRYEVLEVHFDRAMKASTSNAMLSIEPPVPFELKWKSARILQIVLQKPLDPDQRYDLTLNGGNDKQAVFAADGTYLAEEYRWFYWQKPFET